MSNFARWEQESRQPLGPLQPDIPQTQSWQIEVREPSAAAPQQSAPAPAPEAGPAGEQETTEVDMDSLLAAEDDAADDDARDGDAETGDWAYDDGDLDDDREADDAAGAARTAAAREKLSDARRSLATTGRTVGRWVASLDRRPEFSLHHGHDPLAQVSGPPVAAGRPALPAAQPFEPAAGTSGVADDAGEPGDTMAAEPSQFPTSARGYNRQAVDAYIGMLESELTALRADHDQPAPPISITEEIERIGEETASILVVAHDKAHETARRAQDQAQRRVREADARAHTITAEAQRRLRELDEETDLVWRERERLLDDVRTVSASLNALIDAAAQRFPADPEPMAPAHAAQVEAEQREAEPAADDAEPAATII